MEKDRLRELFTEGEDPERDSLGEILVTRGADTPSNEEDMEGKV